MKKYYVNIPGGTKDSEFQQVVDLLKERHGFQEANGRQYVRAQQHDGSFKEQGFLYLFGTRDEAEDFAREIRNRTNSNLWAVFEVDIESIEELIEQHRQLRDEPLLLAMYYDAGDEPSEIYLLEVIDNFGSNSINADRELFEVTFPSENGTNGERGKTWHLVLTNPHEFDTALRENWKHAEKIRRAVGSGRYEVLFMTSDEGLRNRDLIHA
jgi:hypothetical protein